MGIQTVDRQAVALSDQIRKTLKVSGRDLRTRTQEAGRAIPRHVRKEIEVISQAQNLRGHPKIERQIDEARVERAYKSASGWLETVGRGERRREMALDIVTDIAFKLVVVVGVFIAVAAMRGLF